MRFFKMFVTFYVGTMLLAASPIVALAAFAYFRIRAYRRRKLYRIFTGPPVPGSDRWDRKIFPPVT